MDTAQFLHNVRETLQTADCHKRYYDYVVDEYKRCDSKLGIAIALFGFAGIAFVAAPNDACKVVGSILSAGVGFWSASAPLQNWKKILSDAEDAATEWTMIRKECEKILCYHEMLTKEEVVVAEWVRMTELRKCAAGSDKYIPHNEKIWSKCQQETIDYYKDENWRAS